MPSNQNQHQYYDEYVSFDNTAAGHPESAAHINLGADMSNIPTNALIIKRQPYSGSMQDRQ